MTVLFILIGLIAGVSSGIFGIGGGVLIIPALAFFANFSQEKATGTSLAVLLPPVGLLACLEYYRNGSMDLKAALLIALGLIIGAWFGARIATKIGEAWLKPSFGVFLIVLGIYIVWSSWKPMKGL
jgi:uncharacterized membrane protein YfcA